MPGVLMRRGDLDSEVKSIVHSDKQQSQESVLVTAGNQWWPC